MPPRIEVKYTTFYARQYKGGFHLVDTCKFNKWVIKSTFTTLENAEIYAHWAHDFKEGRTFRAAPDFA